MPGFVTQSLTVMMNTLDDKLIKKIREVVLGEVFDNGLITPSDIIKGLSAQTEELGTNL